ncbi:hypothetical protein P692DRAFT_20295525 [Suillus brevipes Sb2]|nr:hypothetical protein P692DRAFT_20295525 [Suillus brevipes Sb2]
MIFSDPFFSFIGRSFHSTTILTSADRPSSHCIFHPSHDDFTCVDVLQYHSTIRPFVNHFDPTPVSLSSCFIPTANSHLNKQ